MNSRIPPGSIALVTGSSSGFGLLTCVELARCGLRVFASMRDLDRSHELDRAMAEAGLQCDKIALDVTSPASIAAAMDEIAARVLQAPRDQAGPEHPAWSRCPVDVLVNNAGYALAGFTEDVTLDELRRQFETNFFGLVALTKAVVPGMRERRRGRIINLSSVAGRVAQPGFGAYCASKFAVEGLSESLRHELLPHGVYVVLVEPGMFPTDVAGRNRCVAARALDPESPNYPAAARLERLIDDRLARTTADPADVARIVALAATAEKPRLRFLVGSDAALLGTIEKLVPFSWWERAMSRVINRETE